MHDFSVEETAQCLEYEQKLLSEEQKFRASHVYVLLTDGEVIQVFKIVRTAKLNIKSRDRNH
jgi:hypothetical protein